MAKRLASSSKQHLYSSEASVADSASEYDQDGGESVSTGSASVSRRPRTAPKSAKGKSISRYSSSLPIESEKALVSILLDPVLRRQRPDIAYRGKESVLGELQSPLRKAVDNRRHYICSPKHYSAEKFSNLVSSLGLELNDSAAKARSSPAIIESDDPLPSSRKMQSPPRFIHSSGGSRGGSRGRHDPCKCSLFTLLLSLLVHVPP
jgi:hypothetical protein